MHSSSIKLCSSNTDNSANICDEYFRNESLLSAPKLNIEHKNIDFLLIFAQEHLLRCEREGLPYRKKLSLGHCILLSLSDSVISDTKDSLSQWFLVACHAWPSVFCLLLFLSLEKLKREEK